MALTPDIAGGEVVAVSWETDLSAGDTTTSAVSWAAIIACAAAALGGSIRDKQ